MSLRYTKTALGQLQRSLAYIEQRSPLGAIHVRDRIGQIERLLVRFPMVGQETARAGMRRVMATPYPYCVFYSIDDGDIVIHGVRHTSRRPLPGLQP